MATTDQALELILSWTRKSECCAEKWRKQTRDLESLRDKCDASDCVGTAVVGAAFLIGATLFTRGATAPLLDLVEATCAGAGATISVAVKTTEQFMSHVTMTEVQDLQKVSNKTAENIQELVKQLSKQFPVNEGPSHVKPNQSPTTPQLLVSPPGKCLSPTGAQQQLKETTKIGPNKSAMAVGGAVGVVCAHPVETDSWKDQIEKNPVTEASQSPRDATDKVLKCRRMFEEMPERQRKHQKTCAESERDDDSDSDDEDGYGDEDSYGEDEDGYGEDEDGYGEDEDEDGEDEDGYGEDEDEDGEDEDGYGEDEDGYGDEEDGYGEDEDGYGDEDSYGEDEDGEDEDGDGEDEDGYGDEEDGYGEDEDGYEEDESSYAENEENDQEDEEFYQEYEKIYGEDEEHDQEDMDSESEEETEDDKSNKTCRKQKTKHQQKQNQSQGCCRGHELISSIKKSRKRKFENHQNLPTIRAGLLNVQSMNNKTPDVLDVITQNSLDVLCTTETWLQRHIGHKVLREASPRDFSFYYQARPGRGGGVAIQFSNTLQHKRMTFNCTVTTFEVVAAVLQDDEWDKPVLIINVYRPPGSNVTEFQEFLDQFEELLRQAFKNYDSIIITGDFNIWFDPENRSYTDEFLWLLPIYDFVQHVKVPTHEAGHILDLVISRNVEISRLSVRDDGISDHYTVYFNVRPQSKETTTENTDKDKQPKRFKK